MERDPLTLKKRFLSFSLSFRIDKFHVLSRDVRNGMNAIFDKPHKVSSQFSSPFQHH